MDPHRTLRKVHWSQVHPKLKLPDLQVTFIFNRLWNFPQLCPGIAVILSDGPADERPAGKCSKAETAPQPAFSHAPAGRHKEDP